MKLKRVRIYQLATDVVTDDAVVILKEENGSSILPIIIGYFEASSIVIAMEKVKIERPLTHDLIKTILDIFNIKIQKVVINELKGSTYYATIYIQKGNEIIEIDARPSDSIAIAVRTGCPIFVNENLLQNLPIIEYTEKATENKTDYLTEDEEKEKFRKFLEKIKPTDFIKYFQEEKKKEEEE